MARTVVRVLGAALCAGFGCVTAASTATPLLVDLTYAIYQGYQNATSGLNIWKG